MRSDRERVAYDKQLDSGVSGPLARSGPRRGREPRTERSINNDTYDKSRGGIALDRAGAQHARNAGRVCELQSNRSCAWRGRAFGGSR